MKQKILVSLAATALLGLTACKGGATAAGGKLIPEQATIMVGIDVGGLMKTKLYGENKAEFEKQKDYSEMAAAAKACNLDPEKALNSVLIGTDGKANVVAVLTGEGLGDEKNLTCIADKAKEKNGGKTPFTIVDEAGKKTLKLESGEGTGYIVDGKTVVFASKAWEGAVKDLIDGKGKSANDGPNKDLFDRADRSKHIWAAGLVPAEMAGGAKSMGADAKDFSVSFDLSDGLALKAMVGLASADQATDLKKKGDDNLPGAKMMAGMMGVPPKALETVKIDTKDNMITVEASLSNDDLKIIKDKAGAMMGGAGGGGDMGGMPMDKPPLPAEAAPVGDAGAAGAPAGTPPAGGDAAGGTPPAAPAPTPAQ
jgi:hypothetical protein